MNEVLLADWMNRWSPVARVAAALGPFAFSLLLRRFIGRNTVMQMAVTLAGVWLALTIALSPAGMDMMRCLDTMVNFCTGKN